MKKFDTKSWTCPLWFFNFGHKFDKTAPFWFLNTNLIKLPCEMFHFGPKFDKTVDILVWQNLIKQIWIYPLWSLKILTQIDDSAGLAPGEFLTYFWHFSIFPLYYRNGVIRGQHNKQINTTNKQTNKQTNQGDSECTLY